MWEINKHLQTGEKIIHEDGPAWIGYFGGYVLALLFIWIIIVPMIIMLYIVLNKLSTKYVVTNKRIAARFGVIAEDFKTASFKHITSVRVQQGILGKIFNFGTIITDTSGSGTGVEFQWKYVKNPSEIRKIIEKHIE